MKRVKLYKMAVTLESARYNGPVEFEFVDLEPTVTILRAAAADLLADAEAEVTAREADEDADDEYALNCAQDARNAAQNIVDFCGFVHANNLAVTNDLTIRVYAVGVEIGTVNVTERQVWA